MKCYLSYSLNEAVRYMASSGGFCKEFLKFSLENKIVDKVIITVLGENEKALVPKTMITDDIENIMSPKSNSIYDRTNPLSILKELNSNESYIFVGLPCHIRPLKEYCKKNSIKVFTISLFCNHTSTTYYRSILNKVHLNESDVRHFEYRGSGWPGAVHIVTDDKEIRINHMECWDNYSKNYMDMLPKCKKCIKLISPDADICVGDAWLQRVISKDKKGTCIVLSMNPNANRFIEDCSKKGYIHLEQMNNSEFDAYHKAAIKNKIDRKE